MPAELQSEQRGGQRHDAERSLSDLASSWSVFRFFLERHPFCIGRAMLA